MTASLVFVFYTRAHTRWFHGKISREHAEALLRNCVEGAYLIRESTTFPGDYTLCVAYTGIVEHYRILNKDKKLTVDEEAYFENLIELIQVLILVIWWFLCGQYLVLWKYYSICFGDCDRCVGVLSNHY